MTAIVHIAGPLLKTPELMVQRCARCGIALTGPTQRHPAEPYGWPDGCAVEYRPDFQFEVTEQYPRTGEDCDPGWRVSPDAEEVGA